MFGMLKQQTEEIPQETNGILTKWELVKKLLTIKLI